MRALIGMFFQECLESANGRLSVLTSPDPTTKTAKLAAEIANGRLAGTASIVCSPRMASTRLASPRVAAPRNQRAAASRRSSTAASPCLLPWVASPRRSLASGRATSLVRWSDVRGCAARPGRHFQRTSRGLGSAPCQNGLCETSQDQPPGFKVTSASRC
eukprot:14624632-Heterocapsa_arctica.AAC.2